MRGAVCKTRRESSIIHGIISLILVHCCTGTVFMEGSVRVDSEEGLRRDLIFRAES